MTTYRNSQIIKKLEDVIKKLNEAGYTGGFYTFKDGECSCCYGLSDEVFFQINKNKPENWTCMNFKISYSNDNKRRAERFRVLANKLVKDINGSHPAETINHAIMIDADDV